MITPQEYAQYASSAHVTIITWIREVLKSEKEEKKVNPRTLYLAIAIRDFLIYNCSWFELLRSSNIIFLTIYDWEKKRMNSWGHATLQRRKTQNFWKIRSL